MTLREYVDSAAFRRLIDEELRGGAEKAALQYFEGPGADGTAERRQVKAILEALYAGGIGELIQLAKQQKEKTTSSVNKNFWTYVFALIDESGRKTEGNLVVLAETLVSRLELPEGTKKETQERKRYMLEALGPAFFEHFVCHYYYCRPKRQGGNP